MRDECGFAGVENGQQTFGETTGRALDLVGGLSCDPLAVVLEIGLQSLCDVTKRVAFGEKCFDVVLDDVSPGLIGAYDREYARLGRPSLGPAATPEIDALLAARGMLFTRAWANPKCTPTRAQVLTGLHGLRSGIGQVVMATAEERTSGLVPSHELLPGLLARSDARYATAAVGKWHLSGVDELARNPLAPLGEPAGRWFERYAGSLYNLGEDREAAPEDGGYWRWEKTYATAIAPGEHPCGGSALPCVTIEDGRTPQGYPTVDTTDDALALVSTLPEPWFLYVAYNAIHEPLHHVTLDLPGTGGCDHSDPSDAAMARCMLAALDGQQYQGVDLSLPPWINRILWKTFRKTFRRDPATGA